MNLTVNNGLARPARAIICVILFHTLLNSSSVAAADFGWLRPYSRQPIEPLSLADSTQKLEGTSTQELKLTVSELLHRVMENNLDITQTRLDIAIADTDLLRAESGQAPRGVNGAPVPSGLFAGALGVGLGQTILGGNRGASISGRARSVSIPPLGTFDPSLSLTYSYDRTKTPLNTLIVSGVPSVTNVTNAYQISYQQGFKTGTGIGMTFSYTHQRSNQQFLRFEPSDFTRFSVAFTQRLSNGFGIAINRRFIDVARNNRIIVSELFRQRVMASVSEALKQYWDLVAAEQVVRTAKQTLLVAQALYLETQGKFNAGILDSVDLTSTRSEVSSAERDLIIAKTNLSKLELGLRMLMSKTLNPSLAAQRIVPTYRALESADIKLPSADDAIKSAFENRPELRQVRQKLRNSDIVANFTRDAVKPSLNFFALFVSTGLSGDGTISDPLGGPPIAFAGGFDDSFAQIRHNRHPEFAFGLTLTTPLGNRRAQADYRRAQLERQRQQFSMENLRNRIDQEVRQALWLLQQTKAEVEAAKVAEKLATASLDETRAQLTQGKATTYQVMLRNRDRIAAQLALVRARVASRKALVELDTATGQTLEHNHIDLPPPSSGFTRTGWN